MRESNFIKIAFEILEDNPELHTSHFKKLLDIIFTLFNDRVKKNKVDFENERLYFVNLITQKFLVHGYSIKQLINGITLDSPSQNLNIKMFDPFSIYSLERTLIENYLVLNYISNHTETDDILNCRFEIWMRYGIKQRKITPKNENEKRVTKLDKESIIHFDKLIKKRLCYQKLTADKKISFYKTIDKEWKIIFNNEKFNPVSWKDLMSEAGIKKEITENIYNYLSWHSHSQSISILQFREMWENNSEEHSIIESLKKINRFSAFLISDIILSNKDLKKSYDNLSNEYKDLINFYNFSYRNENYTINDKKN